MRLRAMVDDNVRFVARMLRKAGVPPSELDDQIQQTFIVAATRIEDVQLGAERKFLYQVALNVAAHMRRTLARRREVSDDRMPERIEAFATPENLTGRKEMRKLLDEVAARMDASLYAVFNLFAFEGANVTEIAARLGVPRGTAASRLRRARAQFREHAAEIDVAWDFGSEGGKQLEGPPVLSREKSSKLTRSLLRAGVSRGASDAIRTGTLAVLGIAAATRAT
jgi:RNA polymerase sigma-70 factor (ECF subfamily)